MNRDQKAAIVEEIAGQIEAADAIIAVDYRGLSVAQAADLRAKLREADTKFRIVKNSLSLRAAEQAGAELLKPLLEGPTALALVHGDVALAAKALNDTARVLRILEFKGGLLNGDALSGEDIRSIARLPSREVLQAQLVGTIAAPLTGLVRGLNALITGLAIQLRQIADQGLVAPAEPLEVVAPAEPLEVASQPPAEAEAEAEAVAPAEPLEVAAQPPATPEPEAADPEPAAETAESDQPEPDVPADADSSQETE